MWKPFRFRSDRRAVTAVEYAMIAGLVAGVIGATVATLGSRTSALYTSALNMF